MTSTFFQILTPEHLARESDARKILELWKEFSPLTFPDRFGSYEPLKNILSCENIDLLFSIWNMLVLFSRKQKPRCESSVWLQYGPHRSHSSWKIAVREKSSISIKQLCDLLISSSQVFHIDFGYVHTPQLIEIDSGLKSGSVYFTDKNKKNPELLVTTKLLQKYLPDIYLVNLFGTPYTNMFGLEKLMSSPAHEVSLLPNGNVKLQIVPIDEKGKWNLNDYIGAKLAVKKHLGEPYFYGGEESKILHKTPTFDWLPLLQ